MAPAPGSAQAPRSRAGTCPADLGHGQLARVVPEVGGEHRAEGVLGLEAIVGRGVDAQPRDMGDAARPVGPVGVAGGGRGARRPARVAWQAARGIS